MKIKQSIYNAIVKHAQKLAPVECCGYLAAKEGVVVKHFELTNVDNSPDHFTFDPKEQFAALKTARTEGLELAACYHSHPVSPARPSKEDIRLAFDPNISYVIISLAQAQVDVKSFKIAQDLVTPEKIEILA